MPSNINVNAQLSGGVFASLTSLAWNKRPNYHSHGASGAHRLLFLSPNVVGCSPLLTYAYPNIVILASTLFRISSMVQARYMLWRPSSPLPRQMRAFFSSSWCLCPHGPASASLHALTSTTRSPVGFVFFAAEQEFPPLSCTLSLKLHLCSSLLWTRQGTLAD